MAAQADRGVPLSTLCPKYLHTNSTSHTWPFSAIAELIDNAYDPDVRAERFWIDKTVVRGKDCLSFMDDGNGLDYDAMHKMLSFGYSDKVEENGLKPIGMYGNGFKSGAMRLGKDAIVFSKSKSASCVGMLSQTYLKEIGATQIIVPIVCFEQTGTNNFSVREEHKSSLQDILSHSPFKTEKDLLCEVNAIEVNAMNNGTRIIIWNLRRTTTTPTEFDIEKDRYDIRIPSDVYEAISDTSQHAGVKSYVPETACSLRAYCSVLYLKPRMQIIIRGQKVKSQLIAKSLAFIRKDYYKPTFLYKRIPITFGYNTKSKDQYGVMMYHKNRLIKAYERVGCQLKANNNGVGVIGVIECDFLEPTHNKQSFNETDKYRKTMNTLGTKLEEYWKEMCYKRKMEDPNSTIPVEDTEKRPDQNWVQCDDCSRWRKLPDGIDCGKLPEEWRCLMNPDPQFRSCQVEEEPEDSDEEQPYQKTYKRKEKEDKKNEERKRQKEEQELKHLEEELKRQEKQHWDDIARQNRILQRKQEDLQQQLRQKTVHPPSTPTTPRGRSNTGTPRGGAARAKSSLLRSTISQAASSPSSSSGLPVISDVRSLSTPLRGKRPPVTSPTTPKRPRINAPVNGLHQDTSDTPVDVCPVNSPSVPTDNNDDTDDEIFIVETASTPKPEAESFNLSKVKVEQEKSDVSMLLECSDDAAPDVTSETSVAETGSAASAAVGTSPAPPPGVASITTQTEVPKVKEEKEDQNQTDGEERARQNGKEPSSDMDVCVEQRVTKQESDGDAYGENQGEQTLQNGVTHHLDIKDSPPHHPSMIEVQEQQDQLIELMQTTAQERDSFKERVHQLTCQVHDLQSRLQELSQVNVKKECSHQESQTEETEQGEDYKSLFEKANQKVNELIKNKEASLAATETKPSTAQAEERDTDEIALQVDRLLRELDEGNKERDELRSQLNSLEGERANLASQCEELRLSLQQLRENAQEGSTTSDRATDSSAQADPEMATGTDSSSDTSRSLIELRHNIGRLLVHFVPALDLGQVNYECDVIDEILEQVLLDPVGLRERAIHD